MKRPLLRYLLWVLLPVGVAFSLSRSLLRPIHERHALESGERFGRLAGVFLRSQMSALATELAEEAPVLSQPDSSSPVIRAALRGDTVAALGTFSGELVLSFALAEPRDALTEPGEEGPGLQVRGVTRPFPPRFLTRLHGAIGYNAALYLRRNRVAEAPDGFGPETLPDPGPGAWQEDEAALGTEAGAAFLLPLNEDGSARASLHLLVAPSLPLPPLPPPWRSLVPLLAGFALGLLVLVLAGERGGFRQVRSSRVRLLLAFCLPVGGFWVSLLGNLEWLEREDLGFGRGELVRATAVLNPGGENLSGEVLAEATGFGVTRIREREVVFSSVGSTLQNRLSDLRLPLSSLPTPGVMEDSGRSTLYASSWETPGHLLILTDSAEKEPPPGSWLHLAVLGGFASLLGLVFLWRERQFISPSSSGPGK